MANQAAANQQFKTEACGRHCQICILDETISNSPKPTLMVSRGGLRQIVFEMTKARCPFVSGG